LDRGTSWARRDDRTRARDDQDVLRRLPASGTQGAEGAPADHTQGTRVQKAHLQTILKAAHVSRDNIELEFRV